MKIHLAGVVPVDSRTTLQTISDSYSHLTLKQILTYKWQNMARILGPEPLGGFALQAWDFQNEFRLDSTALEAARATQRETIWNAVGILNAGWIAAAFVLLTRRAPPLACAHWLLVAGVANLLLWCLIIFGPGGTPVAHSSYADLLLIMLGLSAFLVAVPRWIPLTVLGLQVLNLLLVWLPFRPATPYITTVTQWPLIVFAAVSAVGLLVFTVRSGFQANVIPEGSIV